MEFEEYLNARRLRLGITQKELAEKAEISASYLNLIETGKKKPTPTVIRKIGDVLGGDPDSWLDLAGYKLPELPGENKEKATQSGEPGITVVGAIGEGESPYYGSRGQREELASEVVRVLDGSLTAFGYQPGDLLLLDKCMPAPGDVVVIRLGGGALALRVFDKTMNEERSLGKVVGYIRHFGQGREVPVPGQPASEPGLDDKSDKEDLKEVLQDMRSLLTKLSGGLEGNGAKDKDAS